MATGAWEVETVGFIADVQQTSFTFPEWNWGEVGGALVCLGVILAIGIELKRWIKQKGYRMVLKDRNDKIHAMWLEIIQDGIDDRLAKGKISNKEALAMFADAAEKMKLLDLVPKKRLAPIVKAKLKADRAHRELARQEGLEKKPTIPGGPPAPIVREKFSERLGKAANFWQKKAS